MYIDTHTHLDFEDFELDQHTVIQRAIRSGVEVMINVGADMKGSRASAALARKYDNIYASVGIHPHDATEATSANLGDLKSMAADPKVVAIGEIGLDYFKSKTSKLQQKEAFSRQLELAREVGLPVILHTRDAELDMQDILARNRGLSGVVHFFSGSPEFANAVVRLGFYVSFTGVITFPPRDPGSGSGAEYDANRAQIIRDVPMNRIMIETDCPFAAPVPYRGQRNEPSYVIEVAKKIAEYKGVTLRDIEEATAANARTLFHLP
jgi:TatD DNase family protein